MPYCMPKCHIGKSGATRPRLRGMLDRQPVRLTAACSGRRHRSTRLARQRHVAEWRRADHDDGKVMAPLGIIGSGNIGSALARLATASGGKVVIANSRGPESLGDLISELGPAASAGTVEQAAGEGEVVVVSVPLLAVRSLPADLLADKIVLDTSNYYPFRDGRVAELDSESMTTSELVREWLGRVRLVKAFNNILAHHIPQLARPSGATDRTALPLASDDDAAKRGAAELVDLLGFDPVDAGPLAESWRFEPEAAAYTRLYLADPDTPDEELMKAAGAPVPSAKLRAALASAERVRVAGRLF
ncbi:NAD(P)-binding domain-containing protein [Spirillospora sp. CA-255316]